MALFQNATKKKREEEKWRGRKRAEKKPKSTNKQKSQVVVDKRVTIYQAMLGLKQDEAKGESTWHGCTNTLFPVHF